MLPVNSPAECLAGRRARNRVGGCEARARCRHWRERGLERLCSNGGPGPPDPYCSVRISHRLPILPCVSSRPDNPGSTPPANDLRVHLGGTARTLRSP